MGFHLIVPRNCYEEMIEHARQEAPNECCGMLAGRIEGPTARVVQTYRLVNALASPVEYESESRSMFEAVRDQMRRGLEVLAVYHSHPTSPAIPSRKDLARNYSEDVVNFILSLLDEPPTVRGWWLSATEYREAGWEVGD
jgi:proteasome lid subunit RPN8/RPN11